MKNKNSGFTLAELLAVVAILGIVLAMAVPAFLGMSKASNMDTSISELRTTLMQARQWAITHRESTYVVFPDHNPMTYRGGNEQHIEMAYHAYNAYTKSEGYIGEWRYLQPGIYFIPNESRDPISSNVVNNAKSPFANRTSYATVKFPDFSGTLKRFPAIEFKPDGTTRMTSQMALYLGEGIRTVDYGAGTLDYANFSFPDNSPVFSMEVFPFTGLASVKDYQPLPPPP